MRNKSGFTLVELVVTSSMVVVLAGAGYVAFAAGTQAAGKSRRLNGMVARAQRTLMMMAADIRAVVEHDGIRLSSVDAETEGRDADIIDFVAIRTRRSTAADVSGRCEISYYVDQEPGGETCWLMRRQDDTPDELPFEGGVVEPVVPCVSELDLEFYDGLDWLSEWDDLERFPRAVHIDIIVVDPEEVEQPMHFETTVAIPPR